MDIDTPGQKTTDTPEMNMKIDTFDSESGYDSDATVTLVGKEDYSSQNGSVSTAPFKSSSHNAAGEDQETFSASSNSALHTPPSTPVT